VAGKEKDKSINQTTPSVSVACSIESGPTERS
jgi:hypothetical protein